MPIGAPLFAGKKRVFVSNKAIANHTFDGATDYTVLNPLDGTSFMGPSKTDILANADSAQGQGEWASYLVKGAKHFTGQYKLWLTSKALGIISAMSTPTGAVSTAIGGSGGDYRHSSYALVAETTALLPHTIQESYRGAGETSQAYKIKAVICNGFTIDVQRTNRWSTITADLIGNDTGTAEDLTTEDTTAYMPPDVATPPTKCGLWLEPTGSNNHTSTFAALTDPAYTAAGIPFNNLGSEVDFAKYAQSYSLSFSNNINESDLFVAGSSATTGFIANTAGAYVVNRMATLTMTLDLNADAGGPIALMEYLHNFADASQQSYTMQFTFVNDTLTGALQTPYGGSIVVPAMRVVSATPGTGINGPMTLDVTLEGIASASPTYFAMFYNWDGISYNYHATS